MNKILIVVAHPDDEILGAGGTLIKHAENGDEVYCLILGEGAMSRSKADKLTLEKLHAETRKAGEVVSFKEIFFADFPDNAFDTVSLLSIAKEVEKYLEKIKPEIIYTHHSHDLNIDHRLVFQAVLTASRPCNKNCPAEIYTFETLSSTEWQIKYEESFQPNVYIGIEGSIDKKIMALKKYTSEIRDYPHPRSCEGIKILAQYRGLESGLRYAEAFCLIRRIER